MRRNLLSKVRRRVHGMVDKPLRRTLSPRSVYLLRQALDPISPMVGNDRGTPIDRYFIDRFIEKNAHLVRGRVLEVKDRSYVDRFGGDRVTEVDVVDVIENPNANILADIRDLAPIADDTYDCLIITQVLQYVDDLDAAIATMKRVLEPGGSMLVTVPTMGKLDGQDDDVVGHFWRLSSDSARWLWGKHFAEEDLQIEAWGNVLLGLGFWIGLAQEELPRRAFAHFDPSYACGVMI
ncbi:MAG: methyltransferase domain-containing protein, partial [Phycisphaerales bacterium]|nr:methyltransferase domain-containing protein [Phycisphaerales bacterium]